MWPCLPEGRSSPYVEQALRRGQLSELFDCWSDRESTLVAARDVDLESKPSQEHGNHPKWPIHIRLAGRDITVFRNGLVISVLAKPVHHHHHHHHRHHQRGGHRPASIDANQLNAEVGSAGPVVLPDAFNVTGPWELFNTTNPVDWFNITKAMKSCSTSPI